MTIFFVPPRVGQVIVNDYLSLSRQQTLQHRNFIEGLILLTFWGLPFMCLKKKTPSLEFSNLVIILNHVIMCSITFERV